MTHDAADEPGRVEGEGGILVIRGSGTHRAWNGIRYYGVATAINFVIELDADGTVILDGLQGIPANPTTSKTASQNQFLGLSRGGGAASAGATTFTPGASGVPSQPSAMIFDFYDAAAGTGGQCASLATALDEITFTPTQNGNYAWLAK